MRHGVDGRRLGRNTSHRIAMYRNLANSVIQLEQVVTSVPKAKEAKRIIDRLITLGKSGTLGSRRIAFARTRDEHTVHKLFGELAERYSKRPGGYTRVIKLSERRWGDAANMAVLELVDHPPIDRKKKVKAVAAEDGKSGEQVATDTVGRFKKLFSGRKEGPGTRANKPAAVRSKNPATAGRRGLAGGGGSKSGGSSSS